MEEVIMTTRSAPTASLEAFIANEDSSNELASALELANMVDASFGSSRCGDSDVIARLQEIQVLQQVLGEKQVPRP